MRATQWLESLTTRNAAWWVAACQKAVERSGSPSDDPNHDKADPEKFLAEVVRLVNESMPPTGDAYDPNMRAAATMSLVLALWYGRVHYAKAHDPARPSSLRRQAYDRWIAWALALASIPIDEREDATYFPGQGWDFPFSVEAENGDFI